MVTLRDIAKKVNRTEACVSLALNDKPGVSEALRKEVKKIAAEMGYVPNAVARNLSSKKSNTIGLIIPDLTNPFFSCLAEFINRELEFRKYTLMISVSNQSIETESKAVLDMISNRVEGIIIVPVTDEMGEIPYSNALEKSKIPFIYATAYYPKFKRGFVMTDLAEGEKKAVDYLIGNGHSKILMLGTNSLSPSNSKRIDGAVNACQQNNRDFKQIIEFCGLKMPTFDCSYEYVSDIIRRNKFDCSAIITINDVMALGAMRAIIENKKSVPEDVSVIGYDNLVFSEISTVPLSTVSQNTHDISKICVNLILNKDYRKQYFVKPKLILRNSSK